MNVPQPLVDALSYYLIARAAEQWSIVLVNILMPIALIVAGYAAYKILRNLLEDK